MNRPNSLLSLTLIAALTASILFPLPAAAATEQSTVDRADVVKILELSGELDNVTVVIDRMTEAAQAHYRKAVPEHAEQVGKIVNSSIQEELKQSLPKLADMMAEAWLPHLTQNDVTTLLNFYSSDTWKKLRKVRPEITRDGMTLAKGWASVFAQQADKRIRAKLQEAGFVE